MRLYVPRHALAAVADWHWRPWWGASTVDVLLTKTDEPLAPRAAPMWRPVEPPEKQVDASDVRPLGDPMAFVQPRAAIYRKTTRTLLVASEGLDRLVEVDALSLSPSIAALGVYHLNIMSRRDRRDNNQSIDLRTPARAPNGVALSADDKTAYVFTRASYDLVAVPLRDKPTLHGNPDYCWGTAGICPTKYERGVVVSLADDPLLEGLEPDDPRRSFREAARIGRRLFYDASDHVVSGNMGCAGCHPEGRQDGFVWREVVSDDARPEERVFRPRSFGDDRELKRQTPMLAGRVEPRGPYGWDGTSETLIDRIRSGFSIHRWYFQEEDRKKTEGRAMMLAAFLKSGLVPPPKHQGDLTATERRGQSIFLSSRTGCSTCHSPHTGYSDRVSVKLPGNEEKLRTPDLLFVGGTAPYYHDGRAKTLEQLVYGNADRMGRTSHLSKEDQNALIAFLRTL